MGLIVVGTVDVLEEGKGSTEEDPVAICGSYCTATETVNPKPSLWEQ